MNLPKLFGSLENDLRLEWSLWWFLIVISISLSVGTNETWDLVFSLFPVILDIIKAQYVKDLSSTQHPFAS